MRGLTLHLDWTKARGVSRGVTLLAWGLLFCVVMLGYGCTVAAPQRATDVRVHPPEDITANAEQIRLRMRGLVQPMSGVIVAAADQIMAGTSDTGVRREALLWKIDGVPALREALFQPSALTGVGDAWALTFQMTDYFATGPGARALGESGAIAVAASQGLEAEMARVAASITASGDVSRTREYIRKWAAAHPILTSIGSRESILSHVATSELAASFSTTQAAGSVVTSVDDLNRRLEIYSAQLLDQARWQAELFSMDMGRQYSLDKVIPLAEKAMKTADRATETLDRTLPAVERSLAVVEQTPAMITAEREATTKTLAGELTRATTFAQAERVTTLKELATERLAAEKDVDEILVRQRKVMAGDMEAIATKAVDRAFMRAVELSVGLVVAGFIGGVVLLVVGRRVFRRPRGAGVV